MFQMSSKKTDSQDLGHSYWDREREMKKRGYLSTTDGVQPLSECVSEERKVQKMPSVLAWVSIPGTGGKCGRAGLGVGVRATKFESG